MGHLKGPSAGVIRRIEITVGMTSQVDVITVMRILIAYRARSGRPESAPHIICHACRRRTEGSTEGNTAGSIAAAVLAHAQGRSVGIVGWVEVAVGVTCWEYVVAVLGILVANKARSGGRKNAPPGSSCARRGSTDGGTIGGIAVVTMGHLKARSVSVVQWVEIAVDVPIRVATIFVLRRNSSIVALVKAPDRSCDADSSSDADRSCNTAESVANVAGVNVSVIIGTTGTKVEAVVGIGSGCSWLNSAFREARNSNVMVSGQAGIGVVLDLDRC